MRKRSAEAGPGDEPGDEDWTPARAEAAAVRLLARREHSRAELARKLGRRGIPGDLVEATLDALGARRLQSDTRYAETLVASRIGRGQGPVRIRRELAEQGVSGDEIEAALAAADADWYELARETRRRRFGAEPPADWNERARQARFLEYRGFSGEQIRAALG
jgi:regulatory protein